MTELDTDRWIRRFHRSPPGVPRLICFPHAGGAANFFFRLSAALQPDVQVLAVQYPGRQDRLDDPLVDDITVLAGADRRRADPVDGPADRLLRAQHGRRWSAYEVARRWEPQGLTLEHLFASGRRAPSRHRRAPVHQLDDAGFCAGDGQAQRAGAAELLEPPRAGAAAAATGTQRLQGDRDVRHVPGSR